MEIEDFRLRSPDIFFKKSISYRFASCVDFLQLEFDYEGNIATSFHLLYMK